VRTWNPLSFLQCGNRAFAGLARAARKCASVLAALAIVALKNLATLLQLTALAISCYGVGMLSAPAALIVAGVTVIVAIEVRQ
jgi:hypothetical protein